MMAKDKFTKRKLKRRLIRGEMTKRGISGKEVAAALGLRESTVSQGCATSPRVVTALIERGIPARLFGKAAPKIPPQPPFVKGGRRGGRVDGETGRAQKDRRRDAYATGGAGIRQQGPEKGLAGL